MPSAEYRATTKNGSEHKFDGYRFVVQDCSFDGEKRQTRASTTNPKSGGKYTFTIATEDVWENAHFHEDQSETYILESGEAVLVLMVDNSAYAQRLVAGVPVNLTNSIPHKVWMKKDARLHTVKAAAKNPKDAGFQPSPELETLCDQAGLDNLLKGAITPV